MTMGKGQRAKEKATRKLSAQEEMSSGNGLARSENRYLDWLGINERFKGPLGKQAT